MGQSAKPIAVYLEIGKKRTFANAVDWPGWSRSGHNEPSALEALYAYASRYADVLHAANIAFHVPSDPSDFTIVERLDGTPTTDFGAPDVTASGDTRALDQADLQRFQPLLQAYWKAFDTAVRRASGKELRKGTRGGGRDIESIVKHVCEVDRAYLAQLGRKLKSETEDIRDQCLQTRHAILETLAAATRGELPERGPRGGTRWKPRYFIRRTAWHILDHVWEIEDRVM